MLILSENHLRSVLQMKDVISVVEAGFRALAARQARAPERLHMSLPEQSAVVLLMPASIGSAETGNGVGAKIVSVFEKNSERGLDIVQGIYILLDGDTGAPLAVMDGKFITAIRTAATSAVATRFMTTAGRKSLAVLGAGVQAEFHIEAMIEVAEIDYIAIASRSQEKAEQLARRTKLRFGIESKVRSAEEAVSECDLICACTSAAVPLFDGSLIKPGTHINAVGSFTPQTRELDTMTVARSRVIIDEQSAAGREAGEILIPVSEGVITINHIKGTLADVVTGLVDGRTSTDEITLFKSCGLAIEDLVTAQLAYSRASESDAGVDVAM
jgi:ornithine cyclodeaminase/alanine dehydrogenase-like protein (mu-crystallin family)